MAEGPQVARWAKQLGALAGEPLVDVALPRRLAERAPGLLGQRVVRVRSHGKHLLTELSGGETLHTHAMMWGSWQIGAPPLKLRKDPRYVRVRLLTPTHEAVFFHGPLVELLTPDELARHRTLPELGPDLVWPDFDREEAARRVYAQGERPIGDVVLDQRVVAGIGNIYKSEGLFLTGIDPRRPATGVGRAELERLWNELGPIMRAASEPGGRMIRLPPELEVLGYRRWVYRRRGQPCLRCGTPIEMVRQGALERSSYFCPVCQPLNPPAALSRPAAAQPAPAAVTSSAIRST